MLLQSFPRVRLAQARAFPWRGKSFHSSDEASGSGINRVRMPIQPTDLYGFDTRYEPSILDGKPCVFLDYDLPQNPFKDDRTDVRVVASMPDGPVGPEAWIYSLESGVLRCNVEGNAPDGTRLFDLGQ